MNDFKYKMRKLFLEMTMEPPVQRGEWQGLDTSKSKAHETYERDHVSLYFELARFTGLNPDVMAHEMGADFDWAEKHFQERVSGRAMNPAPSHVDWPYAVRGNADHTDEDQTFDHTYPERYWPVMANVGNKRPSGRQVWVPHQGIRFQYGDLYDVVSLLNINRYTRQAYLPVWFPEDTGSSARSEGPKRVPCSIGYHFLASPRTEDVLDCYYTLRSCDIYRHYRNDMYLTARLVQWMARNTGMQPGVLFVQINNLHLFAADLRKMNDVLAREDW